MRLLRIASVTFAFATVATAQAPATQRPQNRISLEQYLDWEDVQNPQLSPDGTQIIFTRRWIDKMNDKWESSVWLMNADGSNKRQVTRNGKANFGPYFFPDGKRIIFASNMDDPKGRNFDLYKINVDGSGLERLTFNDTFDGFPMFSPDGKKLVFASNRNAKARGDTNVFIADWVD